MKWNRYTIETTTEAEDFISMMLSELGIEGVEIEDKVPLTEADTAKMFIDILPELPPDDGVSFVSFYLDADEDHTQILAQVRDGLEETRAFLNVGAGTITESETEDLDWMNNWKEFFHSFVIENPDGKDLLIKPTWEELASEDADKILVEIDPGISFGTGKHETTQLCIRQLMKYIKAGDQVLDLGCGSGILSIASLKLGAAHLTGTDIDSDCIHSTYENFEVNGLDRELGDFYVGDLTSDLELQDKVGTEKYDVVVANILADILIPMAPQIPCRLKEGGIYITSGIIDFKENAVKEAIEASGLTVVEVTHDGEWVSITARK